MERADILAVGSLTSRHLIKQDPYHHFTYQCLPVSDVATAATRCCADQVGCTARPPTKMSRSANLLNNGYPHQNNQIIYAFS